MLKHALQICARPQGMLKHVLFWSNSLPVRYTQAMFRDVLLWSHSLSLRYLQGMFKHVLFLEQFAACQVFAAPLRHVLRWSNSLPVRQLHGLLLLDSFCTSVLVMLPGAFAQLPAHHRWRRSWSRRWTRTPRRCSTMGTWQCTDTGPRA